MNHSLRSNNKSSLTNKLLSQERIQSHTISVHLLSSNVCGQIRGTHSMMISISSASFSGSCRHQPQNTPSPAVLKRERGQLCGTQAYISTYPYLLSSNVSVGSFVAHTARTMISISSASFRGLAAEPAALRACAKTHGQRTDW